LFKRVVASHLLTATPGQFHKYPSLQPDFSEPVYFAILVNKFVVLIFGKILAGFVVELELGFGSATGLGVEPVATIIASRYRVRHPWRCREAEDGRAGIHFAQVTRGSLFGYKRPDAL
jgi:hypothetical protein